MNSLPLSLSCWGCGMPAHRHLTVSVHHHFIVRHTLRGSLSLQNLLAISQRYCQPVLLTSQLKLAAQCRE